MVKSLFFLIWLKAGWRSVEGGTNSSWGGQIHLYIHCSEQSHHRGGDPHVVSCQEHLLSEKKKQQFCSGIIHGWLWENHMYSTFSAQIAVWPHWSFIFDFFFSFFFFFLQQRPVRLPLSLNMTQEQYLISHDTWVNPKVKMIFQEKSIFNVSFFFN